MSPSLWKKEVKCLWFMTLWVLWFGALFPGLALTENLSGLDLKLYTLQEGHKYPVGQPIGLIAVLKNVKKWPVNTDPVTELEHFFVATDPTGVKHTPLFEERQAADMPPTYRWGGFDTAPAEVLDPGSKRSVIIDDVTVLFPVMKELSGWYTLQVRMPGSRYGWTVKTKTGQVGVLDDKAWHGVIQSNELRIFVAPARGGRLKIRVEDLSTPESTARSDVEVRVFDRNAVQEKGYDLIEAWGKSEVIAQGKTGDGGWVALPQGASCLPEPQAENAYAVLAKYGGEYQAVYLEEGDEGWDTECGGLVEGRIFFKEPKHEYAIFGLDSVWIRQNARIESGDVGAQGECESCLVNQFDVAVDGAWVADGTIIKGDSVLIADRASVWDVQCNDYVDSGEIRGEIIEPLGLPVWEGLNNLFPSVFTPSKKKKDDINVEPHGTRTISSGRYRDISIGSHAKLYLEPGLYHVRKLELGAHSSLICKDWVEIRIAENIVAGSAKASYLGSSAGSGFSPKDVKVYVKGGGEEVAAAAFGQGHVIRANIFAKNGSLTTGEGCILEGCFIAEDIVIGQKSIVYCDCDF